MASSWRQIFGRLSGSDDRPEAGASAQESPERMREAPLRSEPVDGYPKDSRAPERRAQDAPNARASSGEDASQRSEFDPMEHLGQRNELLHVRFGYMADRLEDLKTLTEDFNLLTKPIEEMAIELPKAKARILEYEALLQREVQDNRATKAELADLRDKHSSAHDERVAAVNRSRSLTETLEANEATIADHRIRLGELESLVKTAERRAAGESENRERLESELAALTSELSDKDETLAAIQQQLNRTVERGANLERECQRLQRIVDNQVLQVVDLQSKNHDLEKNSYDQLQTIEDLRERRENERLDRQKAAHAQDLVVSGLSAEKASLLLKVDELTARLSATDQSVSQARGLLGERENALRTAEEQLRTAARERAALERQHGALEKQMTDRSAQLAELNRAGEDATKRIDMLTKALSAKSAAHEAAQEKAQARSDRIDELSSRFEKERSALDAANRRLVEELENERAERTLAQGALKIARESRASLQRQNEALKRSNRAMRNAMSDESDGEVPVYDRSDMIDRSDDVEEPSSNVSPFPAKGRGQDEND